jgi:hypothetical protein
MSQPPRSTPPPRGRRAIAPPPRASRAVAGVVSTLAKSKGFGAGFSDVAARWSEIVGERTARMCAPVKLTGRGKSGVLHVAAVGPAALLVEADREDILRKVNIFCGRDAAGKLSITRAPARPVASRPGARSLPPTARLKLEARLADVADPGLKAALMKLGRALLREQPGGEGGRPPRERK